MMQSVSSSAGLTNLDWIRHESLPKAITNRRELRQFMLLDLYANNIATWTPKCTLSHPQVAFLRALRRLELAHARTGPIARVARAHRRMVHKMWSIATGISIEPGCAGPGLSLAHHGGLVVNSQARLGSFCHLNALVNIGSSKGGAPVIGDFVFIGSGVQVFGDVKVGDGACIGAGTVLFRDLPADTTAVGNPARMIAGRGSEGHMPPWFPRREVVS